ncbi:MAG: sigma 54-interacting transcriptional regulator [Candidatus Alcyoniella australis]|nr:sigma 54-interacting transcriptional regulator [Candidatus Alcyoniella australis]
MNNPSQAIETILDSIADGVFTVDHQWRITSWNAAAERITGFGREQALGQYCYDVFRSNVCQSDCLLRQTLEHGKPLIDRRIDIVTAGGEDKPISISTAVLRDRDGELIGGAETFRDLSAIESLRKQLRKQYTFRDIVSKNHRIEQIFDILPDVGQSESTALILGPSGSGKELFARAIHDLSPRREGPFVAVNCAALPDNLLESELFGYVAGAFTDARRDKPGRFDLAAGGTLFLDEIGDLSAALQSKLLRVLEQRTYQPLGTSSEKKADVRIVAATNRDLRQLISIGRFRDDLYYRLNVVSIELPPLSERIEDVPLLVEHFIERLNLNQGREIRGLSARAMEALMRYSWPGNVRELQNIIERAFVMCRDELIDLQHLPRDIVPEQPTEPEHEGDPLKQAQAQALHRALAAHEGHRQRTADALGIHKTTLLRKMKKFGVSYP